ncbi:MAG: DUF998 domain-containing protein [Gemmatimonas sp.]
MESSRQAGAVSARTNESGFDRGAAVTRSLLGYGMVAGPFYLVIGVIQGFVREGFDFARHPLSVLANGPGGWVQTLNFVLSGLMVIAAAVGFARMPAPKVRAVSWFLGGFGLSMIIAAVFPADPMDGFPVGTPVGPPTSISTTGLMHFAAGTLGFVSLAISALVAVRAMSRRKMPSLARFSLFAGLGVLIGFFGGFVPGISVGTLGIWFAVVIGWVWLAVLSRHLYRVAPDPNCAPQAG